MAKLFGSNIHIILIFGHHYFTNDQYRHVCIHSCVPVCVLVSVCAINYTESNCMGNSETEIKLIFGTNTHRGIDGSYQVRIYSCLNEEGVCNENSGSKIGCEKI